MKRRPAKPTPARTTKQHAPQTSRREVIDDDGLIVVCSADSVVDHPDLRFPDDLLAVMKTRAAIGFHTPGEDTYAITIQLAKPAGTKQELRGPFPVRVGPLGLAVLSWADWTSGRRGRPVKIAPGDYAVTIRGEPDGRRFDVYLERGAPKSNARRIPSFAPADPLAVSETAQMALGLASNILSGMELVPGKGYVKKKVSRSARAQAEQFARIARKQYAELGKRGARGLAVVDELMATHGLADGPITV